MTKLIEGSTQHGHDKKKKNKLLSLDDIKIPFIIKYLSPQYSDKTWEELLEDPEVQLKQTYICENWYLALTEFTLNPDIEKDETKSEGVIKHKPFLMNRKMQQQGRNTQSKTQNKVDSKDVSRNKPPLSVIKGSSASVSRNMSSK